jgi:peptidoglycan/xylan/chitin deacetylase (PgdA/CDA1 family)
MNKTILLTFDVEEFDLPNEYENHIGSNEQISVSTSGLLKVLELLDKYDIRATFFVTAVFAEQNPQLIKEISVNNEIASHTCFHSFFENSHVANSKTKLEEIIGKKIYGFRMPRLEKIDLEIVKNAGYSYDSSINPTVIPNRYNNLLKPRKLYIDKKTGIKILPFSVSPVIRFPLFWLSFKNVNYRLYLWMCKLALQKDDYLHLCFHPWEFSNIGHYKIPKYINKISGSEYIIRFERLLRDLKKEADFSTIIDFIEN